jgi:hypothetical protein
MIWPDVPPLTPLPTPTPVPQPPVCIERTIVPVGTVLRGGTLEWDADNLFATSNRRDLVGHLEGTANPDQRGNIVLIGHNYNRGYSWRGVFYALNRLQAGSTANTLAHIAHLAPTQDETMTLITCGGANLAPFPSRLYATAKRVDVKE